LAAVVGLAGARPDRPGYAAPRRWADAAASGH